MKNSLIPYLLTAALLVQSGVVTPFPGETLATGVYKLASCKALSDTEMHSINKLLITAAIGTPLLLMYYSIKHAIKLHNDLVRGIQEHNNELVLESIRRKMASSLGVFLWIALYNNNHDALKMLLEHKAAPDTPLTNGFFNIGTPLYVALVRDDFQAAHILLDYGANPMAVSLFGETPLFYAYKNEELAQRMRDQVAQTGRAVCETFENTFIKQPPRPMRTRKNPFAFMKRIINLCQRKQS